METNEKGQLTLGGISAVELAAEYGTPLYVMDEANVRAAMRLYSAALKQNYAGNGLICYASKAFCCKEIYRIAKSEGLGVDVVSLGELHTALSVGLDMENVCVHGNNKTREELQTAIICGAGRIVVDNFFELESVGELCRKLGKMANIMLRIKPGIDAHTHDFVKTGQIDSKFGFALENGEAMMAVKAALSMSEVRLRGVHCHIGSQIFMSAPYVAAAETMIYFLADIKRETGVELAELNLGGGFGVPYTAEDVPFSIEDCLARIFETVRSAAKKCNLALPFLILEPGRSIVAQSGTTLYTVGGVKHISGVRTYVSVDGGMCDNIRYILYRAKYEMTVANKATEAKNQTVTVAGKCCESGDLIGENVALQEARAGDILAVFCTGAYNFSMFSTYNRNLRPAVVMVGGGKSHLIVSRETPAEILKNDI